MQPATHIDFSRFQYEVERILGRSKAHDYLGYTGNRVRLSQNALKPMSRIDFKGLVDIHDHEEAFLYDHFYRGLAQSFVSRVTEGSSVKNITKSDIRGAMISVAAAARAASSAELSPKNRDTLFSICPYCA